MIASPNSQRGAMLALLATIVLWAYSWVVMKQALAYAGPLDFAALRYLLGAVILFAAMLATRQALRPPPLVPTILIGLCQTAAFQGLEQWALLSGGAGRVALLAYTMPFWAVLLAWWWLRDRPSPRQWGGLALAAGGLVCIIEPWRGTGSALSTTLAICGGLAWACGTVLTKRLFQRHAPGLLNLTAWQMLIGGLALGIAALAVPQRQLVWNLPLMAALAYSAVLASSVAWWLWSVVLDRLSTTVASVSSLGVPITSVLLAWLILRELPSAMELAGIALVLFALLAVSGIRLHRQD